MRLLKKGRDRGGEPGKSKRHENALHAELSKTTSMWNGCTHPPFETTTDPVIAKSPGVMANTEMQHWEMLQCYRHASRPCPQNN